MLCQVYFVERGKSWHLNLKRSPKNLSQEIFIQIPAVIYGG